MSHKLLRASALLLLTLPLLFTACVKDKSSMTYTMYMPVFKKKAEVLASIGTQSPQRVVTAGKINIYGNYIFLNDVNKGVHIIDNTNPALPKKIGFINIPGSTDIAVKNDILYANIFTDLIAVDISNPMQAKVKKTVNRIFPDQAFYPGRVSFSSYMIFDTTTYVVDWIRKDTTVSADYVPSSCPNCNVFFSSASSVATPSVSKSGVSGSTSRFAIINDYLYAVNANSLMPINITNAADPQRGNSYPVGGGLETIYPFNDKIFIGSQTGMFIYNVAIPSQPKYMSMFSHARMCDPVITDGDNAYITLRSAPGPCGMAQQSQLSVVNVKNLMQPSLVKVYPMDNPYGLSLDNKLLTICDGTSGLKLFDITNPASILPLKTIKGLEPYDVIMINKKLVVTSKEGLVQYDYSDQNNIRELSRVSVTGF